MGGQIEDIIIERLGCVGKKIEKLPSESKNSPWQMSLEYSSFT